jgi:excisionase family DNA binding protein
MQDPAMVTRVEASTAKYLLTAYEVAERLDISVRTVWRWTALGELPAPVRRGRVVRWKVADIEACVQGMPVERASLRRGHLTPIRAEATRQERA